uniref:peroxidase n=1 Tax=Cajanus cajan TaxID=3821 RepID=A0A151TPD9_CAJCA|nr:Peroxidase 52 [Cajanus cajan]
MASNYFLLFVLVAATLLSKANAKKTLFSDFYSSSCLELLPIVQKVVIKAIKNETGGGASLLQLLFHDCFVNVREKITTLNNNSARGFNVIDDIKAKVEKACILALAAQDSVVYLGGPLWKVSLGRRDSIIASRVDANNSIPSPLLNLTALKRSFSN